MKTEVNSVNGFHSLVTQEYILCDKCIDELGELVERYNIGCTGMI